VNSNKIMMFFPSFRLQEQIDGCDAFLVIYSVVDKASFTRAEYFLTLLQDMDLLRPRCCILVGNKIDLARSRAISSQGTKPLHSPGNKKLLIDFSLLSPPPKSTDGKCMACTYRVKFIEVSVGINHNVDELLAGTLTQIRLKKEHCELQVSYILFACFCGREHCVTKPRSLSFVCISASP